MRIKLLIAVLFIGFLLRFWHLGQNPPSLNWDEVSIGYDAYSILKTGKDQFGHTFPLAFRSLDDQKSPLYIYATTLAISIFGKTEFAIRFTSAASGVITIYFLYLFTQKILMTSTNVMDEKEKNIWTNRSANIALFTAGILAITPWHVHFSRVAFEANTSLMFEVLGSYLFLTWVEKLKDKTNSAKTTTFYALGSILSYILAMYAYANAPVFIAFLLIGWSIYFYKTLLTNLRSLILPTLIGICLVAPLSLQIIQGSGLTRYRATSIFYRPEVIARNNEEAKADYDAGQGRLSSQMHNIRIPYALTMLDNYLSHYRFTFLFTKADLPRHQIPGFGLLHNWQLPLILIGAVFLLKNRHALNAFLPLWWLFVAPLPASITWQVPHSIRTEVMLPVFTILSGVGLWAILRWVQQKDLQSYRLPTATTLNQNLTNTLKYIYPKLTFVLLFVSISITTIGMILSNFILLPYENSAYWLYGRKQAVAYAETQKDSFEHILVSPTLDWMYLWFLWYGNYNPQEYLNQGGTISGGFQETQNTVGKIEFKPFPFTKDNFTPSKIPQSTLLIGSPEEFPKSLVPDKQINDLSGKPIIYIVKI
jgi:4-amino-4-deoxy-L-arabinose transferase-like glycosyltransferase